VAALFSRSVCICTWLYVFLIPQGSDAIEALAPLRLNHDQQVGRAINFRCSSLNIEGGSGRI